MKLNPPASSSDLEAAREIARRLHQHRREADRSATPWPTAQTHAAVPPRVIPPPPVPSPPPHAAPPPAPPPVPPVRLAPPPLPEPAPVYAPAPEPPEPLFDVPDAGEPSVEPPSWDAPEEMAPGIPSEPESLDGLAGPAEATPFGGEERALAPEPSLPDVEMEEPSLSPEEMVGEAEPESAEPSPFEQMMEADEEAPAPPSWDEIVEACRIHALATGAMLVDPAGQVFAARGEWPDPGPEAIARKLVSMMEKTLKDAPTRSISAPLMGRHLTAWRVPLAEGLVTAVFIADAPVRADARPAIDSEIHRGAGA